jgi:hypothetical protein
MTDVLRIALDRRDQLQAEIARLDEFIRTAEQLIRTQAGPRPASDEHEHTAPTRMNLLRRSGTAAAG